MTIESLFDVPAAPAAPAAPECEQAAPKMTATDVKDALRRRHPSDSNTGGMVGQWTCIEEWRNIDLLALNAWQKADVIGYEVKVSRSDMRGELLAPDKRAAGVAMTTEFYFAVPAGLLTAAEIAWEEPEWEPADFERASCPGVPRFGGRRHSSAMFERYGGPCRRWERRGYQVRVALPEVIVTPDWFRPADENRDALYAQSHYYEERYAPCPTCGAKGYLEKSRVEREAPTLWVPRDVGLITISARGCRVVKKSPRRKDPKPIATSRQHVNDLVRWVSHRPDVRHRPTRSGA